jgi:hypothetical protein
MQLLDTNCENARAKSVQMVWLVAPFALAFYSVFVFDTLGDAVGPANAAWAPALMLSLSIVSALVWYMCHRGVSKETNDTTVSTETRESIVDRITVSHASSKEMEKTAESKCDSVDLRGVEMCESSAFNPIVTYNSSFSSVENKI